MKKLLFVFAMFVAMSACTGNGQNTVAVETDSVAVDTIDSVCTDTLDCVCPEKDSIN